MYFVCVNTKNQTWNVDHKKADVQHIYFEVNVV